MANQIEQFLIEFVFKDKDVVKGMKSVTDGFEKVNRDSVNKTKKRVKTESFIVQKSYDKMHDKRIQREMDLHNLKLKNEKKLQTATRNSNKRAAESMQMRRMAVSRLTASNPAMRDMAAFYRAQEASAAKAASVGDNRNQRMMRGVERSQYFRGLDSNMQGQYRTQMQTALGRGDVEAFRDIAAASREASKAINRQRRETIGLATAQKGLSDSTRNMLRSYVSLFAVFAGVSSINRVGQEFEGLNSAMLAATGNKAEAGKQMAFLTDLSERLGLSLIDTSGAFTKFLFAAKGKMSEGQTQELFTSLTELGTTLGVSKERMKLSMNAITQINGLPTR